MIKVLTVGTKLQVWHGHALHTAGGLTRNDLVKNRHGKICSKRQHDVAVEKLKNNQNNLGNFLYSKGGRPCRKKSAKKSAKKSVKKSVKKSTGIRKSARIASMRK
jgi:hypothetical protein